ncbi:MAG: hypothetical protein ACP5KY_03095, partial [Thermoproteus sp.]
QTATLASCEMPTLSSFIPLGNFLPLANLTSYLKKLFPGKETPSSAICGLRQHGVYLTTSLRT